MTADPDTATEFPSLSGRTRYVLLVVSSRQRADQRLDVVEFRTKKAARKAMEHLGMYQGFDIAIVDDSV
jgi:hypothetical protein